MLCTTYCRNLSALALSSRAGQDNLSCTNPLSAVIPITERNRSRLFYRCGFCCMVGRFVVFNREAANSNQFSRKSASSFWITSFSNHQKLLQLFERCHVFRGLFSLPSSEVEHLSSTASKTPCQTFFASLYLHVQRVKQFGKTGFKSLCPLCDVFYNFF